MKTFLILSTTLVENFLELDPALVVAEDDLQEICAALVKVNQRRLAEKIADLVSATEEAL